MSSPFLLVVLIALPLLGGVLAAIAGTRRAELARWISLVTLAIDLVLAAGLWLGGVPQDGWFLRIDQTWVPQLGIGLRLGIDGLSLLMVLLTLFLGLLAIAGSWRQVRERVGLYHFSLMAVLSGVLGVFCALDLFLFYFFWELMLLPMVLLIALWGHEQRIRAAIKFFLFTQTGGLLMLVGILGLVLAHRSATGELTFSYFSLLGTRLAPGLGLWLFLGFFVGFVVKLPAVPLHTWLPDAHTEAPTAGSVILAGLMLKTGAYGLLRFAVPLFPEAVRVVTPWALALGALGVLYGGWLAFAQSDLKRLVAYTSVSHLGFVLLGVFAWNRLALQGVVLQMICHGLATGGLFLLAGWIYERLHTRDLGKLGGLWHQAPRMGGAATFLAMASLGLPGLGSFVAEILILAGTFQVSPLAAAAASLGLVVATVYSLHILQAAFHGPPRELGAPFPDLSAREAVVFAAAALLLLWIGLYPAPFLKTADPSLAALEQAATRATTTVAEGRR